MGRKSKDICNNVRVLDGRPDQGPNSLVGSEEKETTSGTEASTINVVVGADISTSVIGLTFIDVSSGKVVFIDSIRLNLSKMKAWDRIDKSNHFVQELTNITNRHNFNVVAVFVEEANMAFAVNRSSANTLFALARFNELVCYNLYQAFKTKPYAIGVRTARKYVGIVVNTKDKTISGKTQVLNQVIAILPHDFDKGGVVNWTSHVAKTGGKKGEVVFDRDNEDKADSFVVAMAGWKMFHQGKQKY